MTATSRIRTFAVTALTTAASLVAQLTPQAIYPLQTDLLDALASYAPMNLLGNSTPPAPPANGVCLNGVYRYSAGGQDVTTPNIGTLNPNDFELSVEFQLAALPSGNRPILMGGTGWRWIGFYVQSSGTLGLKYNNSNFSWSTTVLAPGVWYSGKIKFDNGSVELLLNGVVVHTAVLGPLTTGNNQNFCTNDYSTGTAFQGCIRNLVIANDTTLGAVAAATDFGSGCDGLELHAGGVPTLGNATFALGAANVPLASPLAFIAFGSSAVYPGADLTGLGMTGCASYTTFDLGMFGPEAVVGGNATFALPIPANPGLAGATLAAQAVSFSVANPFGLATSNGTQLVLGL